MPFQSNLFRQNLNRNKIKQQKFFNKPPHYCYIVTQRVDSVGPLRELLPASVSSVQGPSCRYTLSLSLIVFRYCRHRSDTGNTCSVFSLAFLHMLDHQPLACTGVFAQYRMHCKVVAVSYCINCSFLIIKEPCWMFTMAKCSLSHRAQDLRPLTTKTSS